MSKIGDFHLINVDTLNMSIIVIWFRLSNHLRLLRIFLVVLCIGGMVMQEHRSKPILTSRRLKKYLPKGVGSFNLRLRLVSIGDFFSQSKVVIIV
jgi:hypothetical protein